MRRQPRRDDYTILAWYDLSGQPRTLRQDCKGLPLGSPARAALCRAHDRVREALEGQGCQVFRWCPTYWPKQAEAFRSGKLMAHKKV